MKRRTWTLKRILLTGFFTWLGLAFLSVLIYVGVMLFYVTRPSSYYMHETTDVAQYGIYTGTGHNEYVHDYIHSFFPDSIEKSFSDVTYSYRANSIDQYAFEAYLEFVIKDPELFARHIAKIGDVEWETFEFDSRYWEYDISNKLDIFISAASTESQIVYAIESAKIGKILYDPVEQRMIYVAIGVYDGGGTNTKDLCVFFNRFDIDPADISPPRE